MAGSISNRNSFSANRITAIRLICAIAVLISHLDWLAGNSTDYFRRLGLYSVAIFFGLSGFLLTESILRNGANLFFVRNRVLRIFPGFFGVLVLTGLVLAPLYQMIKFGELKFICTADNFFYVLRNITTYILQSDINGSLKEGNVSSWNPPLWTLSYELICYFFLFVLVCLLGARYGSLLNVILPTVILLYLLQEYLLFVIPTPLQRLSYYLSFFFFGSFIFFKNLHTKIKILYLLIPIFVLSLFIPRKSSISFFDIGDFTLGLILIPVALILAFNPEVKRSVKNDYSFGIYIYAAPITHLIIVIFPSIRHNWLIFACSTLGVTYIFAWLSWHFIEKRALELKNRAPFRLN